MTDFLPGLDQAPKVSLSEFKDFDSAASDPVLRYRMKHEAEFDVLSLVMGDQSIAFESSIIAILNHLSIEYRFILIDLPSEMNTRRPERFIVDSAEQARIFREVTRRDNLDLEVHYDGR